MIPAPSKRLLILSALSLGFTTLITQLVLIREFMSLFSGNELIIGLLMASWMILVAMGAWISAATAKKKMKSASAGSLIVILLLLLALLPYLLLFLTDYLRNTVYTPGVMVSLLQILLWSFVLFIPFCLCSGALFTLLATQLSVSEDKNRISRVYAAESWGSVIGGALFSLVLVWFLDHYAIVSIVLGVNLFLAISFSVSLKRVILMIASSLVMAITLGLLFWQKPQEKAVARLFPGQEVLERKETPYGNLTVTRLGSQLNLYGNSNPVFVSGTTGEIEERVHYAMLQHPLPRKVLVVSGDILAVEKEIRKYENVTINFVEVNPWIGKLWEKWTGSRTESVLTIRQDARRYIRKTASRYDAVLLNVGDPSTAELNRYYTAEFFSGLENILTPGGVCSISLPAAGNYMGEASAALHATLYQAMKATFDHVIILPGGRDYYLASDSALTLGIVSLLEKRGIQNSYVSPYYLNDDLISQRSSILMAGLAGRGQVNHDFRPTAYFLQVDYWLSHFHLWQGWIPLLILGVVLLAFFRMNAVQAGLFAMGWVSSSAEIVLLLSFQVITGYLYMATGLLMAVFMAGLALGAAWANHRFLEKPYRGFIWLQGVMIVIIGLIPALQWLAQKVSPIDGLVYSIFIISLLSLSVLVGALFSLASRLRNENLSTVAGALYASDLLGASVGSLLTAAYLVPMLGLQWVCALLGILCLGSTMLAFFARRRYLMA